MHPALLESRAQISEDIGEMREQLRKQVARLRELKIKKIEEPGEINSFTVVGISIELTEDDIPSRCVLRHG